MHSKHTYICSAYHRFDLHTNSRAYFTRIFVQKRGFVELSRDDINEAAESVRRSRKIFLAFVEAKEFENNFLKTKSKIPKTFFRSMNVPITNARKAMLFAVKYIHGRKTIAKSIKQSLKKNCSFKAFNEDLDTTITTLQTMDLLRTEMRQHRGKRDVNGNVMIRKERFFLLNFNNDNEDHKKFLSQYQVIYPGEIFA